MITLQIILSVSSMFIHNCLLNGMGKKDMNTPDHGYRFNAVSYAVCILAFAVLTFFGGISVFTVCLGVFFGVVTALANYYKMLALTAGPMNVTLLIANASMIIPTLSGVFFGERFSPYKLIAALVLLFFIYLSLGSKGESKARERLWLLYCAIAFVSAGTIGILQKVHQSSSHKGESAGLLLIAFFVSLIYNSLRAKRSYTALGFKAKHYALAAVCGAAVFGMNFLNLRLSGLLPSQLFYPLVNGSAIILSTAASFIVFGERLSRKQIIGLFGGIALLIALCLVP